MIQTELVIFDCDGVLVDSEPISDRVFGQMLQDLGLSLTSEQMFEYFMGHSTPHCVRIVEGMLGRALPEGFLREYTERSFTAFRNELKPVPGIESVLDQLRVPFCVASSGEPEKIQTTLGCTGLLPRFSGRLFSVAQVAKAKPAPDVYLFAARQMNVDPSRCVVVEDTVPGVTAGVAAGMTVLGYCAHTPAEKLTGAGAHQTFNDMPKLLDLLEQLNRRFDVTRPR